MKTRNVLVMKIEVRMDEDDRMHGAQITFADADNPRKRSTRQYGTVVQAFDDVLSNLLGVKLRQIAERQEIDGRGGNA